MGKPFHTAHRWELDWQDDVDVLWPLIDELKQEVAAEKAARAAVGAA